MVQGCEALYRKEVALMEHLFLVSIGPVQEFIASARRSRDLWFGSWLLSELSKAAAKAIVDDAGLDALIFPSPASLDRLQPESDLSVANRVLACIREDPISVAKRVREAIWARLDFIADDDKKGAFSNVRGDFRRDVALAQVRDLPELYWTALPLPPASKYGLVRSDLDAIMAARKVTRDFQKVTWGAAVPKCSLDGQRESVIPESVYNDPSMSEAKLRKLYGLRDKAERLCGVGLLKRHGQREGFRVFSTSHVAAGPLLEHLRHGQVARISAHVEQYASTLVKECGMDTDDLGNVPGEEPHPAFGRYDGHILFEERLAEMVDESKLQEAKDALRQFLKSVAPDIKRPLPYYALLVADGDRMGRVIDNQSTIDEHKKLSQALAQFALDAPRIVTKHGGSSVYAGGDDVLAFVPIHTALACGQELAQRFAGLLGGFSDKDKKTPSLSMGIAVCHHLEPLSDALEAAHDAEEKAKAMPGKNALAVTVTKRGGAPVTVRDHWEALDARLIQFTELHRADALPDSAAFELRDLALRLRSDPGSPSASTLHNAMSKEAERILKRKQAQHGAHAVARDVLDALVSHLHSGEVSVDELANELIVARIFADAASMAAAP